MVAGKTGQQSTLLSDYCDVLFDNLGDRVKFVADD